MRKLILIASLLLVSTWVAAFGENKPKPGEISVDSRVQVEHVGSIYHISYKISYGRGVRSCTVELLLSSDGGKTFGTIAEGDALSGDIGTITYDGNKTIHCDMARTKMIGKQVIFKVNVTDKKVIDRDIIAQLYAGIYPQLSYGAMFGMVRKVGWYVKALSDFNFPSPSYDCGSDGDTGPTTIMATGKSQKSRLTVTGGVMLRTSGWCFPYIGAGYGSRGVFWEDINGEWAEVTDYTYSGIALDAGVIFKFGKFAFSVGVNNTAFRYTEAQAGIGIAF